MLKIQEFWFLYLVMFLKGSIYNTIFGDKFCLADIKTRGFKLETVKNTIIFSYLYWEKLISKSIPSFPPDLPLFCFKNPKKI